MQDEPPGLEYTVADVLKTGALNTVNLQMALKPAIKIKVHANCYCGEWIFDLNLDAHLLPFPEAIYPESTKNDYCISKRAIHSMAKRDTQKQKANKNRNKTTRKLTKHAFRHFRPYPKHGFPGSNSHGTTQQRQALDAEKNQWKSKWS